MKTWPQASFEAQTLFALTQDWQFTPVEPGLALDPETIDRANAEWITATVPGTAASTLRAAGKWNLDIARDFDAEDGWWRCNFEWLHEPGSECWLRFEGLASLAEVWLNGSKILQSDNQFLAHEVPVTDRLQRSNSLHMRFASLNSALKAKRPRPRWKTRLVSNQQLRWQRTSLLGRIPGWSPPVAATGPWRPISLVTRRNLQIESADLRPSTDGQTGTFTARVRLKLAAGVEIRSARLSIGTFGGAMEISAAEAAASLVDLSATLSIPDVDLWWPHSHGKQPLYPVRMVVTCGDGPITLDWGVTGFRTVELDRSGGRFGLKINGVPIFCRGACWTTLDIATLGTDPAALQQSLDLFRDAGFNLVRIGGTMTYESQEFYHACAERGILVWQDFCFANMDYPFADAEFDASVREEVTQFLARTQLNPALCLLCGSSEIEQQVAMLGQQPEMWKSAFFDDTLPRLVHSLRPDAPYITSSPTGGTLPFQVDEGLSHYYGVGAYLRPLDDARRAGVRFTSECLAFANVPEPETIETFLRDGESPPLHPRWKSRVPRDSGAGWDFDDVRDHYLTRLYGIDASRLRYADVDRYLYLSRLVSCETMSHAMSEWRRAGSTCQGALVWFWRDLWPGAGWGLTDSTGLPKAPYFALKRACAPIALLLTDEGLNGVRAHLINDGPDELDAELTIALYKQGEILVAGGEQRVTLHARSGRSIDADALIGRFTDLTQSYRFGPPSHDVVVATLTHSKTRELLSQAFYLPDLPSLPSMGDPQLTAVARPTGDGTYEIDISARTLAYGVWLEARDHVPSDNYFSIAPGSTRRLALKSRSKSARFQAWVHSVNASHPVRVLMASESLTPDSSTVTTSP